MATSDAFRPYQPSTYPQIDTDPKQYLSKELTKLRETLVTIQQILQALDTTKTPLVNAINDTTASVAGVPIGGLYRNGNAVQVRVT